MKHLLNICALFVGVALSAQSVSDYKYIVVPEKFKDFKPNEYQLNAKLKAELQKRNYTILSEDQNAMVNNPEHCQMIYADVLNTSSFFKNKITVVIRDCNDKELGKYEGSSSIKEYEPGYRDALADALVKVPAFNPSSSFAALSFSPAKKDSEMKQEEAVVKESTPVKKVDNISEGTPLVFTNGSDTYNKIYTSGDQFIFANAGDSMAFAIFIETSKPGVYRVQLKNNVQTIGYEDGENMVIEIPQSGGRYKPEIYRRK